MSEEFHPIQTIDKKGGKCPSVVTMAAYEVYCHVYGPQEAMVTNGCRGGFSTGELIALLYAKPFPKYEWGARVVQALRGLDHV